MTTYPEAAPARAGLIEPKDPILCSQGGVPYNRAHLEYWEARARKAESDLSTLLQERDELREALSALVKAVDVTSEASAGIFQYAAIHGAIYSGPTLAVELAASRTLSNKGANNALGPGRDEV